MRWTGRFFLRNKALCALFAGMIIIPSGATVYFGILKMSGFELLYNLVRIQYIIDLVWVSMTAFFMSRAEANDLRDCIDVSTGKCFFYERAALKWILLLWGVWNITAVVSLLIGSYRNDAIFALSANWFLRGYLMNIALPQLICILAAAAFVCASHKLAAGFLLILFLFLISPFREQIVWTKAEVPVIVLALNAFQRLFHILYQNGEWGVDVQYGLQTESFRLQLELGWIAALWLGGPLGVQKHFYRQKSRQQGQRKSRFKRVHATLLVRSMSVLAAAALFTISLFPASAYRLTQNFDGAFSDRTYYEQNEQEKRSQTKQTGQVRKREEQSKRLWRVTDYDMTVHLGRMLDVQAILTLQADRACDEFLFTLYHGYKVSNVTAKRIDMQNEDEKDIDNTKKTESVQVSFTQDMAQDIVTINIDQPVYELTVQIDYSGYSNRFYSNSQACLLPGWFAWYPMAGEQSVFEFYEEWGNGGGYGYNPYNRTDLAHITLSVNTCAATNLSNVSTSNANTPSTNTSNVQKQDHLYVYEGDSDAITLLTGNLLFIEGQDLLAPKLERGTNVKEVMQTLRTQMNHSISMAERYTGEDYSELYKKKILLASEDMRRNFFNNEIAVFDDCILVADGFVDGPFLLQYLILQDRSVSEERKNSTIISTCLLEQYFQGNPSDTLETLTTDILRRIEFLYNESNDTDSDKDDNEVKKIEADNNAELQLLQEFVTIAKNCLSEGKAEAFLQALVSYERNPKLYGSDEAFLKTVSNLITKTNDKGMQ